MSDAPSHTEELSDDVRALLRAEQDAPAAPEGAREMVLDRVFATLTVPAPPASPPPAPIAAPMLASNALRAIVASLTIAGALAVTAALRSTPRTDRAQRAPAARVLRAEPVITPTPTRAISAVIAASAPPTVVADASVAALVEAPRHAPTARRAAAEEAPEDLAEEQRLLAEGQRALAARDVGAVLSAVRAHAHRFARGTLAEERDALEIRALLVAQRTDEARARGARFRRRYPDSVFSVEIEQRLGAP